MPIDTLCVLYTITGSVTNLARTERMGKGWGKEGESEMGEGAREERSDLPFNLWQQ